MAYGIDDTIQQKVDAYRGNPAALQRRYAQNRQLIDLLALQKLKSEKDAAARDMQMKMQQQPQTIAQQYEAELAGRTKNEMLTGVAGVMQQRQAQQQRNMQQMANRPQPVKPMAQGGIVGLAAGGQADGYEEARKAFFTEDQIEEAKKKGIDAAGMIAMRDAKKALDPTSRRPDFQVAAGAPSKPDPQNYESTLAQNKIPPAAPPAGDETPPPSQEPESDPLMDAIGKIGSGGLTDTTITVPGSNVAALDAQKYAPDMTEANRIRGGLENIYQDFMESDPESMATERRQDAMDFLKLSPEDQDIRNRIITERKAQENEVAGIEKLRYGDPKKLRRERLISNLIGAQGTTIGSTLGTAAGAGMVKGAQQEAGIDKLRGERFGLQDKRLVPKVQTLQNVRTSRVKPLMLGKRVTSRGTNKFVQVLQVLHNLENRRSHLQKEPLTGC